MARHRRRHDDPLSLSIVTPADQQTMAARYKGGASMTELAASMHYALSTVQRTLHLLDVTIRPAGYNVARSRMISSEDQLKTNELYGRGFTMREVSELLGISQSTVHYRLHRGGGIARPRGGSVRREKLLVEDHLAGDGA
jgi:hypothetical protein